VRDRCDLFALNRANPQTVVPRVRNDNMISVHDYATGLFEAAYNALFLKFGARFQSKFPNVTAPVSLYRKLKFT